MMRTQRTHCVRHGVSKLTSQRQSRWRALCIGLVALVCVLHKDQEVFAEFDTANVRAVLVEQCIDCHGETDPEGAINLLRLIDTPHDKADRAQWKAVYDAVEAGQMPLHGSGYELAEEQLASLLSYSRMIMSLPDPVLKALDPGKPVLRRLTRLEYNNTVRDLFELDYDIFMFTERLPVADKRYFTNSQNQLGNVVQTAMREYGQKYDVLLTDTGLPGDNRAEYGYANRGDTLNFSPLLLEKYLEVAAAIAASERLEKDSPIMRELLGLPPLQRPVVENKPRPALPKLVPDYPDATRIGSEAVGNHVALGTFSERLRSAAVSGFGGSFDVPASLNNKQILASTGRYVLRCGGQEIHITSDADLWFASFATAQETSGELLFTNRIKHQKNFEMRFHGDGEEVVKIEQLGVCVLARKNQKGVVRLTAISSDGGEQGREEFVDQSSGNVFFSWVAPMGSSIVALRVDGAEFSGDYVLLDDLGFVLKANADVSPNIEPIDDTELVRDRVVPRNDREEESAHESKSLEDRIHRFLNRAYRRPASSSELENAIRFVKRFEEDESQGIRLLIRSILSSPEFLFMHEAYDEGGRAVRRLDSIELANRLTYFLWSSMPDERLDHLAASGKLVDDGVMRETVRSMLKERSKSRELSESFAAQWLRLDQLYSAKPDSKMFSQFYSGPQDKSTLHGPMMTEVLLLFETVMIEDRSILELFDVEYTWMNPQLAQLYGYTEDYQRELVAAQQRGEIEGEIEKKQADKVWLRIPLSNRDRGGVMTMAGTLMLTSLPQRTSPVKRGAWLLETVFNRPPKEPKVAFVLEEQDASTAVGDEIGKVSVRERFERHRSDAACFSCHARIDPPGFSLEVFDAIGRLRTHDGDQPVDATGEWNSEAFSGPAEFKEAVRAKETELVRGFVEHLLSYALGRSIEPFDLPAIDKIVENAREHDYRFSTIVEEIVLSYPFQYTRNLP